MVFYWVNQKEIYSGVVVVWWCGGGVVVVAKYLN